MVNHWIRLGMEDNWHNSLLWVVISFRLTNEYSVSVFTYQNREDSHIRLSRKHTQITGLWTKCHRWIWNHGLNCVYTATNTQPYQPNHHWCYKLIAEWISPLNLEGRIRIAKLLSQTSEWNRSVVKKWENCCQNAIRIIDDRINVLRGLHPHLQ